MPFIGNTALVVLVIAHLPCLQLVKVFIEPVKSFFPEAAVLLYPGGNFLEWIGLEPAGSPLRVATTRDETGVFEHLEVFRNGGQAHLERCGQLGDRRLAGAEAGEDGAPGRIGESSEGGIKVVGCHSVVNLYVK